jgi:hypothetical protein
VGLVLDMYTAVCEVLDTHVPGFEIGSAGWLTLKKSIENILAWICSFLRAHTRLHSLMRYVSD